MTRDEFWKWMETCPVKDRLVVADEEDYVDISFAVCKDTVSYHVDLTPAKKKNKPQKTELTLPANNYAKFDECDCHKEAIRILDIAIKKRTAFKSMDELKKNKESKKEIKDLAKTWQSLTQNCFQKNFARMFETSDCNDLKSLEKKKRKLYDLGIQIDQGESIRL